ncbi:MAG: quinoprotein dehydrogenase-associated putative ABC transporter substrate-binding protein [Hyphomicrobiaceae bacterium]|nr:quinoprotein dehydrogenase-associated putative ABC transporter substrate-binding protein [Hyphomicrobiaceae bacterium]
MTSLATEFPSSVRVTSWIRLVAAGLLISMGALAAEAQTPAKDAKHKRDLEAALRRIDSLEPLRAVDHTALKRAAGERHLPYLKVCGDPGNMPFSNISREGYQNKIIEVVADAMQTSVSYFWRPYLERGMTRQTFDTNECDVLLGMPSDSDQYLTTEPVYRTTYVLAWRTDRGYDIKTLDDPLLKSLKIGVYQTSSMRRAFKKRGIQENLELHVVAHDGDLRPEYQPWQQVQKVVDGKLDMVAVWGPFAGWLKAKGAPITLRPVNVMEDEVPVEFSISIGLRKVDHILRYKIDLALDEKKAEIEAILRSYGVPLVECSKCYVQGDLPAHGIYQIPYTAKSFERDPAKISEDQKVTRARLEAWLEAGADLNQELSNAMLAADPERVRFLVEKGAQINKLDRQGYAAIHTAARTRKSDLIALALELGADINLRDRDGYTALQHAILKDDVAAIKLLAGHGADLEARSVEDATPVAIAIAEDHYAAAIALIEAGADVNSRSGSDGLTPLMITAGREASQFTLGAGRHRIQRFDPRYPTTLDLARKLIDRGAQVDLASRSGVTALILAAAKNQIPVVGLLVQAGAQPGLKGGDGRSALEIAQSNGNDQVVSILRLLSATGGQ